MYSRLYTMMRKLTHATTFERIIVKGSWRTPTLILRAVIQGTLVGPLGATV